MLKCSDQKKGGGDYIFETFVEKPTSTRLDYQHDFKTKSTSLNIAHYDFVNLRLRNVA